MRDTLAGAPKLMLRPIFVEVMPPFESIKDGDLWISHRHCVINLRCPCRCGELTVLSIHPSRWHVHFNGDTVSLNGPTGGSVWKHQSCGSHFWIRNNEVVWANQIDQHRRSDYEAAELARMVADEPAPAPEKSRRAFVHLVRRALKAIPFYRRRA